MRCAFRTITFFLLAASPGAASPLDVYGFGASGVAAAGGLTALADPLTGAYYNPSASVGGHDRLLGLGLSYGVPFFSVESDPGNKAISPCSATSGAPCKHLPGGVGQMAIAAVLPLGGKVNDRAALSVVANLPMNTLVRMQSLDGTEPQFFMYQSRPDRLAVLASLAVSVNEMLSVSGGVQTLVAETGSVNVGMEIFDKRFTRRELNMDFNSAAAPVVSWLVRLPHAQIGFEWRGELKIAYTLPATIDMGDVGSLQLDIHGIAHWTPHIFNLAGAYALTDSFWIDLDLAYEMWSRMPNDQLIVSSRLGGDVLTKLGLADQLAFDSKDAPMGFSDIIVARASTRWQLSAEWQLRAGVGWRPSPVPDQVSTTNYLDNMTFTFGGGADYSFSDPLEIFARPITASIGVEYLAARTRHVSKESPIDPLGGYSFGGGVLNAAAMVHYAF